MPNERDPLFQNRRTFLGNALLVGSSLFTTASRPTLREMLAARCRIGLAVRYRNSSPLWSIYGLAAAVTDRLDAELDLIERFHLCRELLAIGEIIEHIHARGGRVAMKSGSELLSVFGLGADQVCPLANGLEHRWTLHQRNLTLSTTFDERFLSGAKRIAVARCGTSSARLAGGFDLASSDRNVDLGPKSVFISFVPRRTRRIDVPAGHDLPNPGTGSSVTQCRGRAVALTLRRRVFREAGIADLYERGGVIYPTACRDFLAETRGCLLFQEQALQLIERLANVGPAGACRRFDDLRFRHEQSAAMLCDELFRGAEMRGFDRRTVEPVIEQLRRLGRGWRLRTIAEACTDASEEIVASGRLAATTKSSGGDNAGSKVVSTEAPGMPSGAASRG